MLYAMRGGGTKTAYRHPQKRDNYLRINLAA
jgi:hypothetical protein